MQNVKFFGSENIIVSCC